MVGRAGAIALIFLVGLAGVGNAAEMPQTLERKPVTLTLANIWNGNRIPLMEEILQRFQQKYPWIAVLNQVGGNEILEKALVAISAGSPPDVLMIDRVRIPEFAEAGLIQPLDPYIKQSKLNLGVFYPSESASSQYKGLTWVLPMPTASLALLYYNRTLFAQAGLDPAAPPQTWDEMAQFAQRLQRVNADGTVQVSGGSIDYFPRYRLAQLAYTFGAAIFGPDGLTADYPSPRVLAAANWAAQFTDRFPPGGSLAAGTRAMETNGEWLYFQIKRDFPDVDLGMGLLPHGAGGKSVNLVSAAWSYGMPVSVKHPYESWLLIEFLTTSEQGARFFALEQARPSPVIRFTRDPAYFKLNPYWNVIGETLTRSLNTPPSPIAQKFIDADIRWYQQIVAHQVPPVSGVAQLQREIEAIISNFRTGQ